MQSINASISIPLDIFFCQDDIRLSRYVNVHWLHGIASINQTGFVSILTYLGLLLMNRLSMSAKNSNAPPRRNTTPITSSIKDIPISASHSAKYLQMVTIPIMLNKAVWKKNIKLRCE